MPLYISFIYLTKAFDRLSSLFKILTLIESFHNNMWGTVQHDGNVSKPFRIINSVEHNCVPTFFHTAEEGTYMHTRNDGKLFNPIV